MFNDPKILGLAFLGGIIPSFLWLWFWLKEEGRRPEPKGLLAAVFVMGILAVIFVLPVQKFIQGQIHSSNWQLIFWAASEEIAKYLAVLIIVYRTAYIDEPIDWPIYLVTAALGFAALENTLFLIKPFSVGENTVGLLTGELRFLGSTLLHAVSSGILGIAIGISLRMNGFRKFWHLLIGFILAISLHSIFNFFIIRNGAGDFLKVFAFLWVVTIIVMLLFEKVRRMD
ncbi:MAG TPA: PrsW family glutamic-type intramembrane protease [Candidatus Paceibacterota bacterium]|jgi:RsiW-degrading membrane proteinase PrsW (M82 family)|nr:PrsW family glutamic-type intramembrane protease [Candidatus Paceibacterota bacterium]